MTELQKRIEEYQQGSFAKKWKGCKAFKDHQSMLQSAAKPDGVIIGVPPAVHGDFLCACTASQIRKKPDNLHRFCAVVTVAYP